MRGYVIFEDRRFQFLDELLEKHGDDTNHTLRNLHELDYIVFGIKGPDAHLRYHELGQTRRLSSDFFSKLKKGCRLYSFLSNAFLKEMADQYHLNYIVLGDNQRVIKENADLTSEAVIEWLISNRYKKLKNANVTIFGYGHLAKSLISYLQGFHCQINVICRSRKYDEEIKAFGNSADFDHIFETSDIYINTVPCQILNKSRLEKINSSAVLLDVSSFPYGFDLNEALSMEIQSVILPSLPSKFAYQEAAQILFQAMKGENNAGK